MIALRRMTVALALLLCAVAASAQTGTVAPAPIQTFFNASGQPCASCKLYTFSAGTSTPLATYTSSALNSPHANPIVLDALGRPSSGGTAYPIYLSPRGYKFELRTSAGTVLWTADNILSVPTSDVASARNLAEGRLTLTTGTPVTTGDVSAATTLYYTPYTGNRIALYDGAGSWNVRTFTEVSLSLASCTASTPYDVFLYDNGGVVTAAAVIWSNATTRAITLTRQDGVLVYSGIPTYRYVGTYYCNASGGQTDDTTVKRYVWNAYNRVPRVLRRLESVDSWTYTTAALRQAGNSGSNQVEVVVGLAEDALQLSVLAAATNSAGGATVGVSIGLDSTTAAATGVLMTTVAAASSTRLTPQASLTTVPAIGRHYYAWLEYSDATGTTTWYGDGATPTIFQLGMTGSFRN
jgi:hypothetical protein